jgi:hypothetical protein
LFTYHRGAAWRTDFRKSFVHATGDFRHVRDVVAAKAHRIRSAGFARFLSNLWGGANLRINGAGVANKKSYRRANRQ